MISVQSQINYLNKRVGSLLVLVLLEKRYHHIDLNNVSLHILKYPKYNMKTGQYSCCALYFLFTPSHWRVKLMKSVTASSAQNMHRHRRSFLRRWRTVADAEETCRESRGSWGEVDTRAFLSHQQQ